MPGPNKGQKGSVHLYAVRHGQMTENHSSLKVEETSLHNFCKYI